MFRQRRMKGASMRGTAALVLACGLVVGCTQSDRPPASELKQGVNLLDVRDPSFGMSAAYVKGTRAIYLETRIGALKPEVYRASAPNDPAHETDMRLIDRDGLTFWVQRGGDEYVDPTWADDIAKSLTRATQASDRALDFELAQEAATQIGKNIPATFSEHGHHVARLALMPPPNKDPKLKVRAELAEREAREAGYSNVTQSGNTTVETDLYSASTGCFLFICTARHSATQMWMFNGSWLMAQNACNHGRCYNGSGMGYHCYSGSGTQAAASITINGETNSNNVAVSGGCATPYKWLSGGYDHLCNSDASYEMWQAKNRSRGNNAVIGTGGGNISFKWDNAGNYACNCNNNNDCDGDWNRPGCP
jgi:hypothetical protein